MFLWTCSPKVGGEQISMLFMPRSQWWTHWENGFFLRFPRGQVWDRAVELVSRTRDWRSAETTTGPHLG